MREALHAARDAAEAGIRIDGANGGRAAAIAVPEHADFAIPEPVVRQMPVYQRAALRVHGTQEPHEVAVSTLADLAVRIVAVEGPIHIEEAARRIASCFGKEKAGSRIVAATQAALLHAKAGKRDVRADGEFWFTREQEAAVPVRDRSGESGATIKAACISMLEIRGALRIARDDNAGGDEVELIRTAARLLGYRRVGPELQARIASGMEGVFN